VVSAMIYTKGRNRKVQEDVNTRRTISDNGKKTARELTRYTQSEMEHKMLLNHMKSNLPKRLPLTTTSNGAVIQQTKMAVWTAGTDEFARTGSIIFQPGGTGSTKRKRNRLI